DLNPLISIRSRRMSTPARPDGRRRYDTSTRLGAEPNRPRAFSGWDTEQQRSDFADAGLSKCTRGRSLEPQGDASLTRASYWGKTKDKPKWLWSLALFALAGPERRLAYPRKILSLPEHRQRRLGLGIDGNQMTAGVGDPKNDFVYPEANHRPDEGHVLFEAGIIRLEASRSQLLSELLEQGGVHNAISRYPASPRPPLRDPRG